MQEEIEVQVAFAVHMIIFTELPSVKVYPVAHEAEMMLKYVVFTIGPPKKRKFIYEKLAVGSPQFTPNNCS